MYRKQVRRRRAVLVVLIIASLILISASFSEAQSGPLHAIQRGVSAVFGPLEEGANRALKPARDLVNWFDETFDARGENEDLRTELAEVRARLADAEEAIGENEEYEELLDIDKGAAVDRYEPVSSRVIGRSPTVWFSTVTIDKGSSAGIETNDAVITGDGLVGRIGTVTRGTAEVELITDHRNAVTAQVVPDGPSGVLEAEVGDPEHLLLDFVESEETISEGATLVTAGWSTPQFSSAYPQGIEIGTVTQAEVADEGSFQRVVVEPFADLREMEYVQVLTGGPERPGVPG